MGNLQNFIFINLIFNSQTSSRRYCFPWPLAMEGFIEIMGGWSVNLDENWAHGVAAAIAALKEPSSSSSC